MTTWRAATAAVLVADVAAGVEVEAPEGLPHLLDLGRREAAVPPETLAPELRHASPPRRTTPLLTLGRRRARRRIGHHRTSTPIMHSHRERAGGGLYTGAPMRSTMPVGKSGPDVQRGVVARKSVAAKLGLRGLGVGRETVQLPLSEVGCAGPRSSHEPPRLCEPARSGRPLKAEGVADFRHDGSNFGDGVDARGREPIWHRHMLALLPEVKLTPWWRADPASPYDGSNFRSKDDARGREPIRHRYMMVPISQVNLTPGVASRSDIGRRWL